MAAECGCAALVGLAAAGLPLAAGGLQRRRAAGSGQDQQDSTLASSTAEQGSAAIGRLDELATDQGPGGTKERPEAGSEQAALGQDPPREASGKVDAERQERIEQAALVGQDPPWKASGKVAAERLAEQGSAAIGRSHEPAADQGPGGGGTKERRDARSAQAALGQDPPREANDICELKRFQERIRHLRTRSASRTPPERICELERFREQVRELEGRLRDAETCSGSLRRQLAEERLQREQRERDTTKLRVKAEVLQEQLERSTGELSRLPRLQREQSIHVLEIRRLRSEAAEREVFCQAQAVGLERRALAATSAEQRPGSGAEACSTPDEQGDGVGTTEGSRGEGEEGTASESEELSSEGARSPASPQWEEALAGSGQRPFQQDSTLGLSADEQGSAAVGQSDEPDADQGPGGTKERPEAAGSEQAALVGQDPPHEASGKVAAERLDEQGSAAIGRSDEPAADQGPEETKERQEAGSEQAALWQDPPREASGKVDAERQERTCELERFREQVRELEGRLRDAETCSGSLRRQLAEERLQREQRERDTTKLRVKAEVLQEQLERSTGELSRLPRLQSVSTLDERGDGVGTAEGSRGERKQGTASEELSSEGVRSPASPQWEEALSGPGQILDQQGSTLRLSSAEQGSAAVGRSDEPDADQGPGGTKERPEAARSEQAALFRQDPPRKAALGRDPPREANGKEDAQRLAEQGSATIGRSDESASDQGPGGTKERQEARGEQASLRRDPPRKANGKMDAERPERIRELERFREQVRELEGRLRDAETCSGSLRWQLAEERLQSEQREQEALTQAEGRAAELEKGWRQAEARAAEFEAGWRRAEARAAALQAGARELKSSLGRAREQAAGAADARIEALEGRANALAQQVWELCAAEGGPGTPRAPEGSAAPPGSPGYAALRQRLAATEARAEAAEARERAARSDLTAAREAARGDQRSPRGEPEGVREEQRQPEKAAERDPADIECASLLCHQQPVQAQELVQTWKRIGELAKRADRIGEPGRVSCPHAAPTRAPEATPDAGGPAHWRWAPEGVDGKPAFLQASPARVAHEPRVSAAAPVQAARELRTSAALWHSSPRGSLQASPRQAATDLRTSATLRHSTPPRSTVARSFTH